GRRIGRSGWPTGSGRGCPGLGRSRSPRSARLLASTWGPGRSGSQFPRPDGFLLCSSLPRMDAVSQLPLTGERTVPGIVEENYWFRRHEAAYLALRPYCVDAFVLEAGCGEGYGADLLARGAVGVLGLDYDALTLRHVARTYPGVYPARANLAALPVRSS